MTSPYKGTVIMNLFLMGFVRTLASLKPLAPLFFRIALAVTLYNHATAGFADMAITAQKFASISSDYASLVAYLATGFELLAVPLLAVGLGTRFTSFLLLVWFVICHFAAPDVMMDSTSCLWRALALFSLAVGGAGRLSLDGKYCCYEKAVSCKLAHLHGQTQACCGANLGCCTPKGQEPHHHPKDGCCH